MPIKREVGQILKKCVGTFYFFDWKNLSAKFQLNRFLKSTHLGNFAAEIWVGLGYSYFTWTWNSHFIFKKILEKQIFIFFSNFSSIFDFIFLCQFNFGMSLVFLPKYFRCNAIINVKISKFNPWPHCWPLIMFSLSLETNFANDMLTMGCDLFWWSF